MKISDIGVVYLYRSAEGEAPVRKFLESYKEHSAGLPHQLHVILKGFQSKRSLASARALFGVLPISVIEVEDKEYDIGSYIEAAKSVDNPKLLFFNTFSEILADGWLEYFDRALELPGVGLVGATGSWQSASSGYEAKFFRGVRRFAAQRRSKAHNRQHVLAIAGPITPKFKRESNEFFRFIHKLPRATLYPLRLYQFGRHPNPHIRTNAFMIKRELFLSLRKTALRKKIDVYKFESGRHSMTKQVMTRGLKPVVVDRFGKIYDIPEWKASSTFWIDRQANLLVADNQTTNYATGTSERRKLLRNYAWDNPRAWDMPE